MPNPQHHPHMGRTMPHMLLGETTMSHKTIWACDRCKTEKTTDEFRKHFKRISVAKGLMDSDDTEICNNCYRSFKKFMKEVKQ